jgi:nitrite reductase/ring-hydroxylating ferredoxin subunit/uncharacterized membrane protein
MKSKVNIKSHPLHPILIAFPIAFFTGTLLFDILGYFLYKDALHLTAYYMEIAGVGFALLAAIPGIIDYFYTVPPDSSGKKRATQHGLTNIITVALFAATWFYRRSDNASLVVIISLEVIGVILLSIAGWMGGTLVYRNLIGVDMRYAQAGKWKEEYLNGSSGKIIVGAADELKIDQMKLLHINGQRIVLGRTENGYVAFDDHCTHRGGSLAGGSMICGTVQCPWHGSQFDVQNGNVKAGPAKENINVYPVTENDGKLYLDLEDKVDSRHPYPA